MIIEDKQPIDLKTSLVDLSNYRKADRIAGNKSDPLVVHTAYSYDNLVYQDGRIVELPPEAYRQYARTHPNDTVNKFGLIYAPGTPLLLHRRLADVLVDSAIDL